jgi:hypothetical protein
MEEGNNDDEEAEEVEDSVHAFTGHEGAYHYCKSYGGWDWTGIIRQFSLHFGLRTFMWGK